MTTFDKEAFFAAVETIADANDLTKQELDDILVEALTKSFHSKYDPDAQLTISIDHEKKDFTLTNNSKLVVKEEIINPEIRSIEIPLAEAKKIKKDVKEGDLVSEVVNFELYSRSIAQQVKQLIIQKVREAKKAKIYSKHKSLIGEMIRATVTSSAPNFAILRLQDGTLAFMPAKFKNPRTKLAMGQEISVYVEDVLESSKDAQVIVSNSSPTMVRRVLEAEVPEIMDGTIEIVGMSRIAGVRTKLAIKSNNPNVDGVGSIIGAGGERINAIVSKLDGEKIDVIRYSSNIDEYVVNAMSPAKVIGVTNKDGQLDKKIVIVPNRHFTLAIGAKGSNARLVAELVKVRIDIVGLKEAIEQGIVFDWNGNITEDQVSQLEAGERISFTKSPRAYQSGSRGKIDLSDFDTEITDFAEEAEADNQPSFVPITKDNLTKELPLEEDKQEPIFTDEELAAMESEFQFDDELADFAGVDLDSFNDEEENE